MDLSSQKELSDELTQWQLDNIKDLVEKFFLLSHLERVDHLNWLNQRLLFLKSQRENKNKQQSQQQQRQKHQHQSPPKKIQNHKHQIQKTSNNTSNQKAESPLKIQPNNIIKAPQNKAHLSCIQQKKQNTNTNEQKQQIINANLIIQKDEPKQQNKTTKQKEKKDHLYPIPRRIVIQKNQQLFKQQIILPLKFLGILPGQKLQNYIKAKESRTHLTNKKFQNHLKQVPNLKLFYFDLVTKYGIGRQLSPSYLKQLSQINKMLMYKIQIGTNCQYKKLTQIFKIHWQNLVQIILQRNWEDKDQSNHHGLDFFTCKDNLKKIKKICLMGNFLTKKFCESLKNIQLPQLQVLEMLFDEQISYEEIFRIFQVMKSYNKKVEIHMLTNKHKNELPAFLKQNYYQRIYHIRRGQRPTENLQKQRPVEERKVQKKAYQANFENQPKIGLKKNDNWKKYQNDKFNQNAQTNNNRPLTMQSTLSMREPYHGILLSNNNLGNNILGFQAAQSQNINNLSMQQKQITQNNSNINNTQQQNTPPRNNNPFPQQMPFVNNNSPSQQPNSQVQNPLQPLGSNPLSGQNQNISGINIHATQEGKITGGVKIATTQITQKTQHIYHTSIINPKTQRIIERYYETDTESNRRSDRNQHHRGNRSRGFNNNRFEDQQSSSSDGEPQWPTGYIYGGRNNRYYNKWYNNGNYDRYNYDEYDSDEY